MLGRFLQISPRAPRDIRRRFPDGLECLDNIAIESKRYAARVAVVFEADCGSLSVRIAAFRTECRPVSIQTTEVQLLQTDSPPQRIIYGMVS
jgi:hypothetical protein